MYSASFLITIVHPFLTVHFDIQVSIQRNRLFIYRYDVTQFADYSEEEFKQHALGLRPEMAVKPGLKATDHEFEENFEIPAKFDWREHGAVTPVKNQGKLFFRQFRNFKIKCYIRKLY